MTGGRSGLAILVASIDILTFGPERVAPTPYRKDLRIPSAPGPARRRLGELGSGPFGDDVVFVVLMPGDRITTPKRLMNVSNQYDRLSRHLGGY